MKRRKRWPYLDPIRPETMDFMENVCDEYLKTLQDIRSRLEANSPPTLTDLATPHIKQ